MNETEETTIIIMGIALLLLAICFVFNVSKDYQNQAQIIFNATLNGYLARNSEQLMELDKQGYTEVYTIQNNISYFLKLEPVGDWSVIKNA